MPIKLLVIDDEDIIRDIWCSVIAVDDKYSIDVACDGMEGLAKIKKNDYDIIITDLNMPVITGLEVVEKAKQLKPESEVIIMTAYGTVEFAVAAMKKGAYDFILKPLDFERIKIVLQKCYKQILFKRENKDLKELNVKLKELNEEKEKFITITSHELRTPTNAISGLITLLYDSLPGDVKGKFSKELSILLRASENLREIVEDMHDLSVAAKKGVKLNKFLFKITNLEKELSLEFKLYSGNRALDFKIDNKLKDESFFGDIRRLKQAAGELIQNAVKFTHDNGAITVVLNKENDLGTDYLTIGVKDTGIGIAENQLPKIFNLFYEVQDTSKHHSSQTEFMGGGIGIGLAIVNEIAQAHNGKVTVESGLDKGSLFKLYIPYEQAEQVKK